MDLCVRPFFSPDAGGVQDDAGDVDEAGVVEPVQHGFVQPPPDAGSRPDQQPTVRRSASMCRSKAWSSQLVMGL
ncbi:hypothetical protein ADL02_46235 [Streptomyces sp. NRRL WC-3723]|nr:hypothetical protein ADL02_46235 [Streptomyces sp. NRRL WC-3723]